MNIEKILEYQKLDTEIKKLEQTLLSSPDQKAIQDLQKVVKDTQALSSSLEKDAEKTMAEWNKMQKNYQEASSSLAQLEKLTESSLNEEQCAEYVKKLNNIASFLEGLEKAMRQTAERVNAILSDYENAKQNYNKAKKIHATHKEKLQALEAEIQPKIAEFNARLVELEKGIEAKFLQRYKAKRQDKIFPIVVPERDGSCGGCGMELPKAQLEKLKKDGFLECENERCHRIIYFSN